MELKKSILITSSLLLIPFANAIDASMRYRSPRNPERKVRQSTELIVLHTTEAPARSSLNKVSDRGECHYCVTEEGGVYAIVDRDREAFHAGRSMWCGKEDVDKFSIGIECVGYHDKPMPSPQVSAIAKLVKDLQAMYRIPDERVVCHSHVAYGAPNKWHRQKHRGRKRCGMLFSMPSMRRRLGLRSKPAYDPDVRSRRLVQADPYLEKVLYGNIDTMRSANADLPTSVPSSSVATWAGGTGTAQSRQKTQVKSVSQAKPKSAVQVATSANQSRTPSALKPKSNLKTPPASIAELKARGFSMIGCVSKENTARKIAGDRWNSATTYYTIRDKVIPGNIIDPAHIERAWACG